MGTKPAKGGHLAPCSAMSGHVWTCPVSCLDMSGHVWTRWTQRACRSFLKDLNAPRADQTRLAKVGPLPRGGVKSAKVAPTPYVYYPRVARRAPRSTASLRSQSDDNRYTSHLPHPLPRSLTTVCVGIITALLGALFTRV